MPKDAPRPSIRLSLRWTLIIGFGGLTAIAVAGVLTLGYMGARATTQEMLQDMGEAAIDSMIHLLERDLDPVVDQALWIQEEVASGRVNPGDLDHLDAFLRGALAATVKLTGFALYTADYRKIRHIRGEPEATITMAADDPLIVEFADGGRDLQGSVWGRPFVAKPLDHTVINLQTPLRHGNEYVGLLVQGVTVSDLSRILLEIATDEEIVPFILYDKERVLAHPLLVGSGQVSFDTVEFERDLSLPSLESFADGVLPLIWSPEAKSLNLWDPSSRTQGEKVVLTDLEYTFLYQQFHGYADKPLTIGVYFRSHARSDALISRLNHTILFGIGILVVAVGAAVLVGRGISRPILKLAETATEIREGDLDRFRPLPPTMLKEIDEASQSFNTMVDGLRERQLVRNLLGRYVPKRVAATLIKDKGVLKTQSAEATILFSDIAGFTSLSEQMSPEGVVAMLNSYFTVATEILESHNGMITQFQGDGILAVFNVPTPDPEHAAQAVRSAMDIQRAVTEQTFSGHRLSARIGITTGAVVAGSVGAEGRLSYTVHGDVVNLAARLEQMNKQFGTNILVFETTVEQAEHLPFEKVGTVEVRGKAKPVTVYTMKT